MVIYRVQIEQDFEQQAHEWLFRQANLVIFSLHFLSEFTKWRSILAGVYRYNVAFSQVFTVTMWHSRRCLPLQCGILRGVYRYNVAFSEVFTFTMWHSQKCLPLQCGILRGVYRCNVAFSESVYRCNVAFAESVYRCNVAFAERFIVALWKISSLTNQERLGMNAGMSNFYV